MRCQWSRRRGGLGSHSTWNRFPKIIPMLPAPYFWSRISLSNLSPLCQMISSNWEASVADFERSFLYLQMVLVISIFYALFPLQVKPSSKCPPSKPSSRCLPSKPRSQAIVLVLMAAAKSTLQVLSSSPFSICHWHHQNSYKFYLS